MTASDVLALLPHLPRTVRSIVETLHGQQPLTAADIRERTRLPRRTVYAGLLRLKEIGVLQERPSLRDARQSYYWLDVARIASGARDEHLLTAAA